MAAMSNYLPYAEPSHQFYQDRRDAGKILGARVLDEMGLADDTVVVALPRGGVPVGSAVAAALQAPLDVMVVRKLGVPGHEEYAIGAIATGGFQILNEAAIADLGISDEDIARVAARERDELKRRESLYRGHRRPISVAGRQVVLVDDGLATGFSMRAAIGALRAQKPKTLIVAVPVGAPEACAEIEREVDALICPLRPDPFYAVGLWYRDFEPTTDAEVSAALAKES